MTGVRFNWKIENPSIIWRANVSEIGRSIQTPQIGEVIEPEKISSDFIFKTLLEIPREFQEANDNKTLVLEMKSDMRQEDDVTWTLGYQLYWKQRKTFAQADNFCKSKGGHLASIHSEDQQALAIEALAEKGRC